jgi:hypothetical protein
MITHFACFVSSATWPEASKPVSVPVVKRLRGHRQVTHGQCTRHKRLTNIESNSIPEGRPFRYLFVVVSQVSTRPFSAEQRRKTLDAQVEVKTNFAERNP